MDLEHTLNRKRTRRGEKKIRKSAKDVQIDGSDEQKQKTEQLLHEWQTAMSLERDCSSRQISFGVWDPTQRLVELLVAKGKRAAKLGYIVSGGTHFLYPEEALFLVEQQSLVVYGVVDGSPQHRPLSFQQCHELCVRSAGEHARYMVFSKLTKQGYVCRRHTCAASCPYAVDYAVYRPASRAAVSISARRPLPPPDFYLAVVLSYYGSPPPSVSLLTALAQHSSEFLGGKAVRFAVVDGGSVSFFAMEAVSVPVCSGSMRKAAAAEC